MAPGQYEVYFARNEQAVYPDPPFHPPREYSEFAGTWLAAGPFDPQNAVYPLVREALFAAVGGFDAASGEVDLAALRAAFAPRRVLVKPNWVIDHARYQDAVSTHGAVLRAVLDYLLLAYPDLDSLIVGDVPLQSADIEAVWRRSGVPALARFYEQRCRRVRFLDLRRERAILHASGFIERKVALPGDPAGYAEVVFDERSRLEEVSGPRTRFSVAGYEPDTTTCQHAARRHRYLIARSALEADLFVNVPKLKTHVKAGITGCMKNLVGVNGEKGWIPHYREGPPGQGGDEFPDTFGTLLRLRNRTSRAMLSRSPRAFVVGKRVWTTLRARIESARGERMADGGGWPGNDTIWRSVHDLVRMITLAATDGTLTSVPQRSHLCVVDGIVAGERDGPLDPTPRPCGLILAGRSPVAVDLALTRLAGFRVDRIAQLSELGRLRDELGDLVPPNLKCDLKSAYQAPVPELRLAPPPGWEQIQAGEDRKAGDAGVHSS